MGFPSYKEDLERARDDWDHLRRQLDEPRPKGDPEAHLRALRDACDRLAARFDDLLELATDPDLQLAHEIVALQKERNDLKSAIGTNNAKHAEKIAELCQLRSELEARYSLAMRRAALDATAQNDEIVRLKVKVANLQGTLDFERAGRADFGSMIEKYPPRSRKN